MQRIAPLRSLCRLSGGAGCCRDRGWIEGGGVALSSQAKDRMRSASDKSCPARLGVRAKRGTYTVGLLASRLAPEGIGAESMTRILRRRVTWRAQ